MDIGAIYFLSNPRQIFPTDEGRICLYWLRDEYAEHPLDLLGRVDLLPEEIESR
jgi:hypothetical protein